MRLLKNLGLIQEDDRISMKYGQSSEFVKRRLNSQIVIVINGKGGVGKDTICDIASELFHVTNISAITPIKQIATTCGWNGEKDQKARKFLSDLKRLLIEYNDLPNRYLVNEYEEFKRAQTSDILFVHIREAYQISDFLNRIDGKYITLLVRSGRSSISDVVYGNASDDDVEQYRYDYVFENDCDKSKLYASVHQYFSKLLKEEGVLE